MEQQRRYKKRLSLKFVIGFLILGIFVITSGCVVGYIKYTNVIEKMYNDDAYRIAGMVMQSIDGDLMEDYVNQVHEAAGDEEQLKAVSSQIAAEPEYQALLGIINVVREEMDANYIYIADQTDGKGKVVSTLTYLFDAENPDDDYPPFVPGDTGTMNESFMEDSQYIYQTGKRSSNYFYSHSDFGYNTSAIAPIKNSNGEVVAIIGVELAMETLQKARAEYILYVAFLGALLTAFIIMVFIAYLNRKVINPIKVITEETAAFISNETEASEKLPKIRTGDEIEQMAASILKMQEDIGNYIENLTQITAEREKVSAELNIATKIQADMLPCIFPAFPERPEFDIYASMVPAKEVGGDFYDFFMIDDNRLAMVIADVSGKGVPAALFMVISKTLLQNYAQSGLPVGEILEETNNRLCENNQAEMFVTVWLGILELSSGKLTCANAGHEYPAINRRGTGKYELLKDKHGFVLAGMEDMPQHEYEIQLQPGDKLFVYTDGVAEATDKDNQLYGTERMIAALNTATDVAPEDTLCTVKQDVDAFVGEAPQFDDITMLCLEYKGSRQEDIGDKAVDEARVSKEISLDATIDNVAVVTDFIEEEMEALKVPMKVQAQMNIAIDEIFSNIAYYAYEPDIGVATVRFEAYENPMEIALTFIDKGIPYNPLEKEDPNVTLSAEDRDIGGLGIFMIKKSMDEITYCYEKEHNILRIKKEYKPE